MTTGWIIFFAVFLAVIAVGLYVYLRIRKKIRAISMEAFGTPDFVAGVKAMETEAETRPRSLSGCDTIVMPRILADFPDFDPTLAKTYAKRALTQHLQGKEALRIHNVVFCRYFEAREQKTILMQAAVQYRENGRLTQKRYELLYAHLLQAQAGGAAVAANCPQCGGAIGFGMMDCPYCGSRVAGLLKGAWEFTEIREC